MATVHTKSGTNFQAKQVVVSVPPHFVARIDFQPPLPGKKKLLMENMPMGTY